MRLRPNVLILFFVSLMFIIIGLTNELISRSHAAISTAPNDLTQLKTTISEDIFRFDPAWNAEGKSPFAQGKDGYTLKVNIGDSKKISFPAKLNSTTPIVISTKYGNINQYLVSNETYMADTAGRYLVYSNGNKSILYRYDTDKKELREFVYINDKKLLGEDGEVVQWRFEGAELSLMKDGSATLIHRKDPQEGINSIEDSSMQQRIRRFLAKRYDRPVEVDTVEKRLFVIPEPVYVDGTLASHMAGVRYSVNGNELALYIDKTSDTQFPIWVDPSLTADADADVILNGQSADDSFGLSVSTAGDFNGDGKDDVIVGALFDNNNGSKSGSAFIFFGGKSGTFSADSGADVILNGQSVEARFGKSVSTAGDFNGDGKDDVIVGANTNGSLNGGIAFIFFGGITGTFNANSADVILNGQSADDNFGSAVSTAGDFNGDGKDDVIVGASLDDNNGSNSGSAFIFFGGITGTFSADASADVILNGQSANIWFGNPVSTTGDFNGDGKDDVIVGVIRNSNNGGSSGSAFIFFGGITGTFNANSADVILNGQSAGDWFGSAVSTAGDFNGDGKDDVIVGAAFDDNNGSASGSAFIFFGGITGTFNADADSDVILNGQDADDNFGRSAVSTAGDFNGDGKDDVIVGAAFDDNNGSRSGSAFIFFGGKSGTFSADSGADVILNGQDADDRFGSTVSTAGDFNGDGIDDVIVGAGLDDNNGQNGSGSAFIFFAPFENITFYFDFDEDGFGDPDISIQAGTAPQGYVEDNTDCNDNDADIFPGNPEVCDEKDNNCDGQVDEGDIKTTFYRDSDGDSFGDPDVTTEACTAPDGYVSDNTDCDDNCALCYPGANEILNNGVDEDCNGADLIAFDIDPEHCPNRLKVKGDDDSSSADDSSDDEKADFKVAILGTQGLDVITIDITTLNINGVAPVKTKTKDVTAPSALEPCDCEVLKKDKIKDLELKFDSQEIIATMGAVQDGDIKELTLTGNLLGGAAIEGMDCVVIEDKGDDNSSGD